MEGESKLEYLDISSNLLSGGLTNCWMQWKSLVYIDLGHNILTGKIPHSMGLLANLISLNLYDNKFFGEVPMSLKSCQSLSFLDLAGNKLSGPIQNWMGQGLKALNLRSNEFSGNILEHICQLNSLMVLDFANNRLSGPIPKCLQNMKAMVSNNPSFTRFRIKEADIPWRVFFPCRLIKGGIELRFSVLFQALDLSNNNLSGTVPLEVFKLTRLIFLNLSHNQLMGMIPQEIGNLIQLELLDLSSNRFFGQIPRSISNVSELLYLNLSFNNFRGKIPEAVALQSFSDLSYIGNPELCGIPLGKKCTHDEKPHNTNQAREDNDGQESEVYSWWSYLGFGIGFATGLVGAMGVIFFNRRCRCAYFKFLDQLCDMIIPSTNIP